MAEITSTVVERLDLSDVLRKLAEQKKAEAALAAQSTALGVSKRDLVKAINAQEKALDQAVVAELQAAKQSIAASERKAAAAAREAAALEKRNAAAKQRADEKAYLFSVRAASEELDKATDSTASMAAATGNLRSQLIDIGVQLQGGASPFTALSQQGPQIAEVFLNNATMASRFAAVLPVIGTAAAGAAAVGAPLLAWYTELGDQNERLAALTDETAVAMGRLSDAATKVAEAEKELAQREGTLAGTVSEDATREIEAQAKATETYGEMIAAFREEIGALKDAAADLEEQRDSIWNLFDLSQLFGGKDVNDRIKDINKSIADREQKIAELGEESETFVKRTIAVTKAENEAKDAMKGTNDALKERQRILDEAGRVRENQFLRDQQIMQEWQEWQEEDNAVFAKVLQARAELREQQVNDWVEGVEKQHAAEVRAAEESAKLAAGRRSALLGVTEDLASVAADAFGAESAVAKAAALIQVAIAEAEVLAKAATLGPIAGPIYAGIGTASVAIAASQIKAINPNIESYNDTPAMQRRTFGPSGGMVKFAPGDTVEYAAARRPSDLARQTGGSGPSQVSTTIKLQVAGRTAQTITALAENTRRGRPPGSPIPGRRPRR